MLSEYNIRQMLSYYKEKSEMYDTELKKELMGKIELSDEVRDMYERNRDLASEVVIVLKSILEIK